ncbi:MAG: alpha/beta hydrolase [Candidatus Latescibacterota bacterium]|jgi:pimeloyl-ACP methyl ester carboxylesterase
MITWSTHRIIVDRAGIGAGLVYLDNQLQTDRPALLLLHGLLDNKATWGPVAQLLGQEYRLLLPDLLGCGRSDKPRLDHLPEGRRYSVAMHAEHLADLLVQTGVNDLVLGGSSLGAGIAVRAYLGYPEVRSRTRGLLLLAPAIFAQPLPRSARRLAGWGGQLLDSRPGRWLCFHHGLADRLLRQSYRRVVRDPARIPPGIIEEAMAVLREPGTLHAYRWAARNAVPPDHLEWTARLTEITCPVLAIWGWEDGIVSPLNALRLQQLVPQTRVQILDDCGHAPQLEDPDQVATLMRAWMAEVGLSPPASPQPERARPEVEPRSPSDT